MDSLEKGTSLLLTVGESGRMGCQPAAAGRGRARRHSLLEATPFRAPPLTSQIGERLRAVKKWGRRMGKRGRERAGELELRWTQIEK